MTLLHDSVGQGFASMGVYIFLLGLLYAMSWVMTHGFQLNRRSIKDDELETNERVGAEVPRGCKRAVFMHDRQLWMNRPQLSHTLLGDMGDKALTTYSSKTLEKITYKDTEFIAAPKSANQPVAAASWKSMYDAMLSRYRAKYPGHGPRETTYHDEYDDEMKALFKEHLGKDM